MITYFLANRHDLEVAEVAVVGDDPAWLDE
jgi:hypothetical protein